MEKPSYFISRTVLIEARRHGDKKSRDAKLAIEESAESEGETTKPKGHGHLFGGKRQKKNKKDGDRAIQRAVVEYLTASIHPEEEPSYHRFVHVSTCQK